MGTRIGTGGYLRRRTEGRAEIGSKIGMALDCLLHWFKSVVPHQATFEALYVAHWLSGPEKYYS